MRSFQTRDQTHVSCIGRQIFNHWSTSEVPTQHVLNTLSISGKFSVLSVLPLLENSRSQPPSLSCYLVWAKSPSLSWKILKSFTSKNHQEFPLRSQFFSDFSWGIHFVVQQKVVQHCKATIPQLKKKEKKKRGGRNHLKTLKKYSWGKSAPYNQKNFMLCVLKVNTYYST